MSNELYEHKRSDTVKWVISFFLILVLLVGMVGTWVFLLREDETPPAEEEQTEQAAVTDGEGNAMDADMVYPMPAKMSFNAQTFAQFGEPGSAAVTSEKSVEVRIEAYVIPENANNREVDFSVAWGEGAQRSAEPVTDYVTVTPESDGSRIASVVCKKAFDDDTILITATTRDGGFQATCTVRSVGIAEGMEITSSDAEKTSSAERGEYYVLGTNKTYTFDVVLSDLFDDVQSELSVEVSGAGALYFGNGSYNDGGYLNYTNVVQKDLSELADKFITSAELSGTTLTVKTGSQVVENYYSSRGPDEDYVTEIFYDRYVVEVRDDTMGFKTAGDTFNNQNAKYNAENIGSCYFTVTVKDEVSGLSQSIRLWLVSSVNGIALSAKTMEF